MIYICESAFSIYIKLHSWITAYRSLLIHAHDSFISFRTDLLLTHERTRGTTREIFNQCDLQNVAYVKTPIWNEFFNIVHISLSLKQCIFFFGYFVFTKIFYLNILCLWYYSSLKAFYQNFWACWWKFRESYSLTHWSRILVVANNCNVIP